MSPRGYHAILGLFNIARGKTYSGVGESVTEKSAFTTTAKKKKKALFYSITRPLMPHHRILQKTGSIQSIFQFLQKRAMFKSHYPPAFLNWACQHCQKVPKFMSNYTLHCEEWERKLSVIKILWDTLLGFTIKMYYAFLDSAVHGKEDMQYFSRSIS